jgi:hypothetical protein
MKNRLKRKEISANRSISEKKKPHKKQIAKRKNRTKTRRS